MRTGAAGVPGRRHEHDTLPAEAIDGHLKRVRAVVCPATRDGEGVDDDEWLPARLGDGHKPAPGVDDVGGGQVGAHDGDIGAGGRPGKEGGGARAVARTGTSAAGSTSEDMGAMAGFEDGCADWAVVRRRDPR